MKKIVACFLVVLMVFAAFAPVASARGQGEGGILGFIIGCCFGARSGAAYNDGKSLHWKEWALIIPVANIVVEILNGVDAMNGMNTADMAAQYGAQYY
jgi:hypothetical protein